MAQWWAHRRSLAACAASVWGKTPALNMSETKRFLQLLVQILLLWSDILRSGPVILIPYYEWNKTCLFNITCEVCSRSLVSEWIGTSSSNNRSTPGWWRWPPREQRWNQSRKMETDNLEGTRGRDSKCILIGFTGWFQTRDGMKGLACRCYSWRVALSPPRSLSCWGGRSCLQNQRSFRAV